LNNKEVILMVEFGGGGGRVYYRGRESKGVILTPFYLP